MRTPTAPPKPPVDPGQELEQGRLLAESFLADVQGDRLDPAYAVFTAASFTELRKPDLGRDEFARRIKQLRFKKPRLPFQGKVTESPPYGCYIYRCKAESDEGEEVDVVIVVMSKDGALKVCNYAVNDASILDP
jgi:hypothetical protein